MIAVIVPTIPARQEIFDIFMKAWQPLFDKHGVIFLKVLDGEKPTVNDIPADKVMGKYADCLSNFNASIRNLGFAFVAKYLPDVEYIITLDDDEVPIGDTIADHISALNRRVPVSWISTAVDEYMRGFPYGIREEAEVVLSHGVWEGVADWDAPTQLVLGSHRPVEFYKGPIPKGVYYPMCGMNIAFKRCMLPYIYQAPWADGVKRFDDILTGVESKREIDAHGWAVVTGYARTLHERASNVFTNLENEATGMRLNEEFWSGKEEHPYFKTYRKKYEKWQKFLQTCQ
jgi:reversibly glycosylated polypeptide/UDP-arabinopyranose mutase